MRKLNGGKGFEKFGSVGIWKGFTSKFKCDARGRLISAVSKAEQLEELLQRFESARVITYSTMPERNGDADNAYCKLFVNKRGKGAARKLLETTQFRDRQLTVFYVDEIETGALGFLECLTDIPFAPRAIPVTPGEL
ncbi:MAG: hypothetical protein R3C60_14905 [Parvularculaceae bacterium]